MQAQDGNHWAKEVIDDFDRNGFFSGDITIIQPDVPINKGEFALASNKYFSFGKNNTSFDEALLIAKDVGYMQNANFSDYISREEACVVFCKMIKEDGSEDDSPFTDSGDISIWAKKSVSCLAQKKIIIGYPDLSFRPKNLLTKAEFFTMLSRVEGSGGTSDVLPIDLVNEEIDDIEIGIIHFESGEVRVELIDDELQMQSGETLQLSIALPQDEYDSEIYFETEDENLITFDKELGLLVCKSEGGTQITFTTEDKKYIKKININTIKKEEAK